MPLVKNQTIPLAIESLASDGNGVGHFDGQAVFVPGAAPGDTLTVQITKALKTYAYGRVVRVDTPGPGRCAPDCPIAGPCGGCHFRHLTYAAECAAKAGFVRDAFRRLGGLDLPVADTLPAPCPGGYRNKVQLPVGRDQDGHLVAGFYAGRSHRIVPLPQAGCRLQPGWMNALARRACALLEEAGVEPYDEETHTGRLRHIYMRQGWHSGQRLLCFVVNGNGLPGEAALCEALQKEFDLTTILINRNTARTNVILGPKTRTVCGPGCIADTLAGVPITMGVHEFYQVNTPAAEALYAKAREFAGLRPGDFLLDLYCGMGTIGLSMLPDCRKLLGWRWCRRPSNRPKRRRRGWALGRCCRFPLHGRRPGGRASCRRGGKAGRHRRRSAAQRVRRRNAYAIVAMAPRTVVMVSCNAATAARDAQILSPPLTAPPPSSRSICSRGQNIASVS